MHKKSKSKKARLLKKHFWRNFLGGIALGSLILTCVFIYGFENKYKNRVYPGISINGISFSGLDYNSIYTYWQKKSEPYSSSAFSFYYENHTATVSGITLDIGFDATLSAKQALSVGRSGNLLTDLYIKYRALLYGIDLSPLFKWKEAELDNLLISLSQQIDQIPQSALFEFKDGRVTAFKTSQTGKKLDKSAAKLAFTNLLKNVPQTENNIHFVPLTVIPWEPEIKTEDANNFGIKELIGQGTSYFRGSITGRIHNIALAASRINGTLIAPDAVFSFNDTVGDISAATGYKQAYVIKSGRTVLDDGGGVCQVSTTFFRAALNSGLPIIERHAHSYRVGYYEQGGFKPGFDATVYAPSYDLKIKNNTDSYILIQSEINAYSNQLTFSLYGQKDGRQIDISAVKLYDSQPSLPDLYQDDPTLPDGEIKQVDWAAPGIKASFDYKVIKNGEILSQKTFFSNYIPWQAVYLRGTKT